MSENGLLSNIETIAVICSSIVTIVTVFSMVRQTKIQKETELSKLYYNNQIQVYNEFYEAVLKFDTGTYTSEDYRILETASQKAKLISFPETAKLISDICKFCNKHAETKGELSNADINEFITIKTRLEDAFRSELHYYQPRKKLCKRILMKWRSIYLNLKLKILLKLSRIKTQKANKK